MKAFLILGFLFLSLQAEWEMFTDGVDTYIYSQSTGEVYIRVNRGKNKYEDVFVKMPRGVLPSEMNKIQKNDNRLQPAQPSGASSSQSTQQDDVQKYKMKALEATKQMYENVLQ